MSRSSRSNWYRRSLRALVVAAAAVSPLVGTHARATSVAYSWVAGSGTWGLGGNWSGGSAPVAGSAALISNNDAANRLITYNVDSVTLRTFTLDQTGAGTTTLSMTGGTFGADGSAYLDEEYVGFNGRATFNQSGGLHQGNLYNEIHLGENAGAAGAYNLGGGTLAVNSIVVGINGAGTLTQTGGAAPLGLAVDVGSQAGGSGTVNLVAGRLAPRVEYIGNMGTGRFNQSGGENAMEQMYVANGFGSAGTYTLSAGTLSVPNVMEVGGYGSTTIPAVGVFNQSGGCATFGQFSVGVSGLGIGTCAISGGSFTVSNRIGVGDGELASGTLILNGGTLDVKTNLAVGNNGHGTAIVGPAATLKIAGWLNVGVGSFGVGTFVSNGNSFNTTADDVGVAGQGQFIQNGGTRVTTWLIAGDDETGVGTYVLNSGTYIAGNEYIGEEGVGKFVQTGGTHVVGDYLTLSDQFTYDSAYIKSGGTVSAVYLDNKFGTFTQTGGVATFASGVIGQSGSVNVSGAGRLYTTRVDQYSLNVGTGGFVACAASAATAGASRINYLNVLSISGTGKWDLSNNDLIVRYGALPMSSDTMRGYIASGYTGGSWAGNGLTSSAAAAQASSAHRTALGYAQTTDLFNTFPAVWNGTVVDATALLVHYTLVGDSNLDSAVDLTDFTFLAANFNKQGNATWVQGDYNYDGNVDLTDFTLLAGNFNQSLAAASGSPGSPVPEPGAFASLCCASRLVLRRRRRGRRV